jgi:hypothetical protein
VINKDLTRQLDQLDALFQKAREMRNDLDLLGHWGRYLCVLSAGFLENSIREIYGDRARRCSTRDVSSYVIQSLERVQNPKAQRFLEVTGAFNKSWAHALDKYLSEDDGHRKNSIDSIMNNRHLIAHGRNANISVARVREYLDAGVEVLEFIESMCGSCSQ